MTTKKYSLRKVKVGVASVLVGFGVATTGAVVANAADAQPNTAAAGTVTKEDVAEYFTNLEADAEKAINTNDKITDKDAALKEAKDVIGKEALLAAIDAGEITPDEVLKDLAESSKTDNGETAPDKKPQVVKDAKPADKELSKEDEAKLKEAHVTQWVTEDGDVLLEEQVEADQNFLGSNLNKDGSGYHEALLADGFEFVRKEVVDNHLTRYIYKNPSVKHITQWVDADGDILFESEGDIDKNYDEYHSILTKHGYELLGEDDSSYTVGEGEKMIEVKVTGYVYKKGPNYKKITSYVPTTAPVADALPEFKGGVNGAEPAVLEKPEFTEKTNEGRFVVEEGKAKADEAKAQEAKEGTTLPNTGLNSTSTTVAGLGLIALVGLAVRRKLAK